MQFALNNEKQRIHIDEADVSQNYYCPFCGNPMIQRRGQINIPHFAHAKGFLCSDSWHYEEMTEWHLSLQRKYPIECREVVMEKGGEKHRADICINNNVIEFQHSPISLEEFQARNNFYISAGYNAIWLFDERETFNKNLTASVEDPMLYHWRYAPKTLTGLDLYGNVQIYFQINETESKQIIRLISCQNGDLCTFRTDQNTIYDIDSFVSFTKNGLLHKTKINLKEFQNEFFSVRRTNGETEYFGCPINYDGYAPMIREENRTACDDTCPYFQKIDYEKKAVLCTGKYHEHLNNIQLLLNREVNGKLVTLLYLNQKGKLIRGIINTEIKTPAHSILELAKQYKPKVMIVRHINLGTEFKISRDPIYMYNKYNHKIYGKMKRRGWGSFENKGREIYYATEPFWVMEWFLPTESE